MWSMIIISIKCSVREFCFTYIFQKILIEQLLGKFFVTLLPFFMTVATYCLRITIASYLRKVALAINGV